MTHWNFPDHSQRGRIWVLPALGDVICPWQELSVQEHIFYLLPETSLSTKKKTKKHGWPGEFNARRRSGCREKTYGRLKTTFCLDKVSAEKVAGELKSALGTENRWSASRLKKIKEWKEKNLLSMWFNLARCQLVFCPAARRWAVLSYLFLRNTPVVPPICFTVTGECLSELSRAVFPLAGRLGTDGVVSNRGQQHAGVIILHLRMS